ncbi:MAG TPA: DUF4926 domain-containing protein [Tepidisphaeraceae bacterium]|jgi:hypothetical protein|nr:DUF4926 domain-containing protein [Tepidisphaeraceae bacterium]
MAQERGEERVQLIENVPELGLHRGDVGLVCSTWFEPSTAFEVEFQSDAVGCRVRALLMPNQIQKDPNASTN